MMKTVEKFIPSQLPPRDVLKDTEEKQKQVVAIIDAVRIGGDEVIKEYTARFDGVALDGLRVSEEEIQAAYEKVSPEAIALFQEAICNIRAYHERQVQQSWFTTSTDGTLLGQQVVPLDRVAVYAPGGTASYPSSVLMTVIPAQCAGVKEIVLVSPPNKMDGSLSPYVLACAKLLGITEIYKMGGAQAMSAVAYGTETIRSVDKIVGPGNIYVALAKRELYGVVDIDMIAGPSELVVLADESAKAHEVAADLLSQAEHDPLAVAIAVVTDADLAQEIASEVEFQLSQLPRESIARAAWNDYGAVYVVENIEQGVEAVNALAPEHLEVIVQEPISLLGKIRHAGAIFLGRYSSEPVGDYWAGPNHVLPTSGTARFFGALEVSSFVKRSSVIYYSQTAWAENVDKIAAFARLEGLEAHARAVESRKRG
ncbi:MAG: histidinol dehydrogenase [Bacilli bacterium]